MKPISPLLIDLGFLNTKMIPRNIICIYSIKCIPTNDLYIGQTTDLKTRIQIHRNDLKHNTHHSNKLQDYYNEYGNRAFKWEVLECPDIIDLSIREQYYIDLLKPTFNLSLIVNTNRDKPESYPVNPLPFNKIFKPNPNFIPQTTTFLSDGIGKSLLLGDLKDAQYILSFCDEKGLTSLDQVREFVTKTTAFIENMPKEVITVEGIIPQRVYKHSTEPQTVRDDVIYTKGKSDD